MSMPQSLEAMPRTLESMPDSSESMTGSLPPREYRIGDVARHSGLSRQTVHNYTIMGLISEKEWSRGGHRIYDASVFAVLERIVRLKRSRTLREIRHLLKETDRQRRPNLE
ncbi:MAG: MerR family transcriptional regulator [Sedimentisphaerales bacterium]|nr:MerR family transcriptional regulator [Sedimentisphaerales bacterium]